jgi:hypothetical protein
MSQTAHPDLEEGNNLGVSSTFPKSTKVYKTDDDQTQSAPNQQAPSQEESTFGDSSRPLFSIYYKAAKEEDSKMAERWQKDADGILFFVSPCVAIHTACGTNWDTIDRFILCCSCCTPCRHRPGPEAK